MRLTLATHNDTDGYSAMVAVALRRTVARTIHVARYADVGDILGAEVERLAKMGRPEELVVTDVSVEAPFVAAIEAFAAMNAKRGEPHRLTVLDHHVSSVDALRQGGMEVEALSATRFAVSLPRRLRGPLEGTWFLATVDVERSATRIAHEHFGALPADTEDRGPGHARAVARLVELVDAVDLWRRERPCFDLASVVSDAFFDTRDEYVPIDHAEHDAFLADFLVKLAAAAGDGADAGTLEEHVAALRRDAVEAMFARVGHLEDDAQRGRSVRMRLARFLAGSKAIFAEPAPGVRMAYAMAPGLFQKTVDAVLESREVTMAVNVMGSGSASFRSRGGQALEAARRFGGGGHADSAGAKVSRRRISSLSDAVESTRDRIAPPASPLGGAFAAALAKAKAG